jgi:hypothetical protein
MLPLPFYSGRNGELPLFLEIRALVLSARLICPERPAVYNQRAGCVTGLPGLRERNRLVGEFNRNERASADWSR